MKTQATRMTPKQLAYMAYWQARGHQFERNDRIPESTSILPRQMDRPRAIELVVTSGLLIAIFIWQWLK